MGKWDKYVKKYNEAWEKEPEFKDWLQKTPDTLTNLGKGEAFCRLCKSTLRPHRNDLREHAKSLKHKQALSALPKAGSSQTTINSFTGFKTKTMESKKCDLKLSAFIACHTSTQVIDHLGEMLKEIGNESPILKELRLHRTKCSKLIAKVIAPCFLREIIKDIGDSYFSIICDESTDVSVHKFMALCIRYYSYEKRKMITDFLGIIEIAQATAIKLYEAFKLFMKEIGLKLERMIGLGTDGAANMCGPYNSLFAYLKKNDCPNLQLVRCICHALDNSSSEASKVLPSSLEYLLRESTNWFSMSALRRETYSQLYKALNCGKDPPLLIKLAKTRWLSWHGAVSRHLDQYMPLKSHFETAAASRLSDRCYTAKELARLHNDLSHLLYLTFLNPILRDVARINVVFQSNCADISKVYADLRTLVLSLGARIVKPEKMRQSEAGMLRLSELEAMKIALLSQENLRPVDQVVYGENFRKTAEEIRLSPPVLQSVKEFCAQFLLRLTQELVDRLPSCMEYIDKMRGFVPSAALARRARPEFKNLPFELLSSGVDVSIIESQWISLGTLSLNTICFELAEVSLENIDIIKFWDCVWRLKDGAGRQTFKELAESVIKLLSLPLSNAVVERVFSVMKIAKNRLRNKLSKEMLSAILRIRIHLKTNNLCCKTFEPTNEMLSLFNAAEMYDKNAPQPSEDTGETREELTNNWLETIDFIADMDAEFRELLTEVLCPEL